MTAQEFNELIQEAGYSTRSYSGRGMYGKECLAFECANGQELGAVAEIVEMATLAIESETLTTEVVRLLKQAKTDSMGLGTIVYFPRIEYVV